MSLPAPNRNREVAKLRPLADLRAVNAPGGGRTLRGRSRENAADDRCARRERPRILVAGADPGKRAAVVRDLRETLPADTRLGEAGAVWEVLEQAPTCGVVMLADDLGDVSAQSLMRVLGQRYPSLPVVALGAAPGTTPPDAAAAAGRG
jgi:hypothetical protein